MVCIRHVAGAHIQGLVCVTGTLPEGDEETLERQTAGVHLHMCVRVFVRGFILSLTCTESKVSRKQLSVRALITEIKAASKWSLTELPRPVDDVGTGVRL